MHRYLISMNINFSIPNCLTNNDIFKRLQKNSFSPNKLESFLHTFLGAVGQDWIFWTRESPTSSVGGVKKVAGHVGSIVNPVVATTKRLNYFLIIVFQGL